MVLRYDLVDSETEMQRVRCPVCVIVSVTYFTAGMLALFYTALRVRISDVFSQMWTESSIEAASLTAPKPGRIQVDAVDVFES